MGESSNSARGKVARTPINPIFTRSMKISSQYFFRVPLSCFEQHPFLVEAMGKSKRIRYVIKIRSRICEHANRSL
jgi:hypothetical protein